MKTRIIKTTACLAVMALSVVPVAQADWAAGVAAFQSGNYSTAVSEFQAIIQAQPEWPGAHLMLGQTYLMMKKPREAVDALKKAYELSPEDPSIQIPLGQAYLAAGRFPDAAAFLSKVPSSGLDAKQQERLARLKATAYVKSGQGERALTEYKRAVSINPNDADLQFQYGITSYNAGDTATAVSALAAATRLDSGDATKQKAYAQALIRQGRLSRGSAKISAYEKAISAAQRVVSANASYDNLLMLSGAQMGAKRYEESVATLQRAATKNPNDWLPHFDIGRAYIGNGQFRSAESAFKNALDKPGAGDQKDVWKQLAYAYEKQKKFDDAILAYNKAGDSGGAARAQDNKNIAEENREIEAEAAEIKKLKDEQEEIRKQLEELPGGPPPSVR